MTGIRKSGPEPPASRTGPILLLLGMIISGGRCKARPSLALAPPAAQSREPRVRRAAGHVRQPACVEHRPHVAQNRDHRMRSESGRYLRVRVAARTKRRLPRPRERPYGFVLASAVQWFARIASS